MEVRNEAYFLSFCLASLRMASGGETYYYGRQAALAKAV